MTLEILFTFSVRKLRTFIQKEKIIFTEFCSTWQLKWWVGIGVKVIYTSSIQNIYTVLGIYNIILIIYMLWCLH